MSRSSSVAPSRSRRSARLWAAASLLALTAATAAPQAAHAASFTAGDETQLQAALLAAGASADAQSTITLTAGFALTGPVTLPNKQINLDPAGFTLTGLTFNGPGTLAMTGASGGILPLTGNSTAATLSVRTGETRLESGATVTTTGETNVIGGTLIVDGVGSVLTADSFAAANGGNATIHIRNGGVVHTTSTSVSSSLASASALDLLVTGAGSRLDIDGSASLGSTGSSSRIWTIADGADATVGGSLAIGAQSFAQAIPPQVTVTGTGSTLTTGGLTLWRGGLSVLDGGVVTTGALNVGPRIATPTASLLISDAGSRVIATGDVVVGPANGSAAAIGSITLVNGGALEGRGAFTLGGLATGVLNIGGGESLAAAAPGELDTALVNIGTTTSRINFNHTETNYAFAPGLTGAGAINQVAGVTHLTGNSSGFTGAIAISGGELHVDNTLGGAGATGAITLSQGAKLFVSNGGAITTSGLTTLNGDTTIGANGLLSTGILRGGAAGTINTRVEDGGQLILTGATSSINQVAGSTVNLTITGAGSKMEMTNNTLQMGSTNSSNTNVTVADGAAMNIASRLQWGTPSVGGSINVTATDAGTILTAGASFDIYRGSLQVLAGAQATAGTMAMGGIGQTASVLVSGAGSSLTLTGVGASLGNGSNSVSTITVANGGTLTAGALSLGSAFDTLRTGIVNIGGVEGGAATAAGTLNANVSFLQGPGRLNFNHTDTNYSFASAITGAGAINHVAGVTHLTGNSSGFSGATNVSGGALQVDGRLGGAVTVASGGRLGGSGTLTGSVAVANGGVVAPGNSPGTLTIGGALTLNPTSRLDMEFGQQGVAGGPLNDLIKVGGALTLDGFVDVTVTPGGAFDAGLYRIISYGGALSGPGLTIGSVPGGATATVQTAVAGQINLVNTAGLPLNFWDGANTVANGAIEGGAGVWDASNTNWTLETGTVNSSYTPGAFAIFAATAGVVTVDASFGAIRIGGAQFAVDGYALAGDAIELDPGANPIRVGDGTADGDTYVATIDSQLVGAGRVVKTDRGTLVLNANNSYAGGTEVSAGTLVVNGVQTGAAANLVGASGTLRGTGTLAGDLTVNGVIAPGGVSAPGALTIDGALILTSTAQVNARLGQAGVVGGALNDRLQVNGDLTLDGVVNISESAGGTFGQGLYRLIDYTGALTDNGLSVGTLPAGAATVTVQTAVAGQVNLFHSNGMPTNFWDGANTTGNGVVDGGAGVWTATGANWTESTGAVNTLYTPNTFAIFSGVGGAVTVDGSSGAIRIGGAQFAVNGYDLSGDAIELDGAGVSIRVGDGTAPGQAYVATIGSNLTGSAKLTKTDLGTLVLNGANTYAGGTEVSAGTLVVNGVQTGGGANLVGASGTLRGTGTLAGDLTVNGVIAPGGLGAPGVLTIGGDLTLASTAQLNVRLGAANVVGGALNDRLQVNGDLTLDGSVNVTETAGGAFGQGVYRLIDYTGALTNNGLAIGALPASAASVTIQTAVAGQVNLVNASGLPINFWDGVDTTANGFIEGGAGVWTATGANWTDSVGGANAAYSPNAFAIFSGVGGAVTVDGGAGAIRIGGAQFAEDGYSLSGDDIELDGAAASLRVGNGGPSGQAYVATVNVNLTGAAKLTKTDLGTLVLNGANTYAGGTEVAAGTLVVNGVQTGAAANLVGASGTLRGDGTLGGDLTVNGVLAPGGLAGPGVLTLNENLVLAAGAQLDYRLGAADVVGGPLNDRLQVNGDLTLDGVLNVTETAGGAFGPGLYRLIDYTGVLNDLGLTLGSLPGLNDNAIQTAIAGQINLLSAAPSSGGGGGSPPAPAVFDFWDGDHTTSDGVVSGGSGVWRAGASNWATASGSANGAYADDIFAVFAGEAGVVTVDASAGAIGVKGLQLATSGYRLTGDAISLQSPDTIIRVGDGTTAGSAIQATIASALTGPGRLHKTDTGTLILTGANTYSGGTLISGGALQVGDGGATGSIQGDVVNDGALAFNRSDAVVFAGALSGAGRLTQLGAGTLTLTADSSAFTGPTEVRAGALAVNGVLGGGVTVFSGARLSGVGQVGALGNLAGGVVAPGVDGVGTLTVAGDYIGSGGALAMDVTLAGDSAAADRLVVRGATSGVTSIVVNRLAGSTGAATGKGVLLVQVDGASAADAFTLANGDYRLGGEAVLVAGPYGYVLRRDATDGDWRLRSSLDGQTPLYQPGVPVYEAYPQAMQLLNGLGAMRERLGARQWAGPAGSGVWGRLEGGRTQLDNPVSTTGAELKADRWKLQFGLEPMVSEIDGGSLVAGLTAYYGEVRTRVASASGDGNIESKGYGVGATFTWQGVGGGYLDAQAQVSGFDSDLSSRQIAGRIDGSNGKGYAAALEAGRAFSTGGLKLTPQAQLSYSTVDFDRFTDSFGAVVSSNKAGSLIGRVGLALDHAWGAGGVYAVANISHEFLDGTRVDVSGVAIANRRERTWAGLAGGGTYAWGDGRYVVYGEAAADTSVTGFGDSYDVTGTVGFRLRF